jgi:putative tricarboxylic transport membrane protein
MTRTIFLGVLGLVLAGYAAMAAQMPTRLPSGQLGPGFFPQVVGIAAVALCVIALLRGLRGSGHADHQGRSVRADHAGSQDQTESGGSGVHPDTTAVAVLASAGFFALLLVLGAVPAAAVFLLAMLTLLDRRRLLVNLLVAVALPGGLYLLFEVALHASLPAGVFWS